MATRLMPRCRAVDNFKEIPTACLSGAWRIDEFHDRIRNAESFEFRNYSGLGRALRMSVFPKFRRIRRDFREETKPKSDSTS